jgi:outer membrane porin, OprD family
MQMTADSEASRCAAIAILSAAILSIAAPAPAGAQSFGEALKQGLYDDASLSFHVRSYYFDRTNPRPPNNVAWAGGGWVGYETGWFLDAVRFGVVGYTSQPFAAPPGTDGTFLLAPGQLGYTVLGQAYGKLRMWGQEFTGYRQSINQPEVNPQDNRMTPNTFEAYTLAGQLGDVTYFAGYVASEKTRNETRFRSMAQVAGAPDGVNAGMGLAGFTFAPDDSFKARLSGYHVPDILTSGYADAAKIFALTDDIDLRLSGQFMVQGSTGLHLLTGQAFSTWAGGVDVDLLWGPVTLSALYTQTGSAAAYRTPYGTWAGYSSMIIRDFNRANEGAAVAGIKFDLAAVKLPGFALTTNVAFGNGALDAATRLPLSTNNEYDFTLDYLFANSALDWPRWLRPLWIRSRAALADQYQNGALATIRDYRVILNYEWKFGGKGD